MIYYSDLETDCLENYNEALDREWFDVDNDGELELYIGKNSSALHGGMILDARNGEVYVLDEGNGTAAWLSTVNYQGKYWVVHSNISHGGVQSYQLDQYKGADIVETIDLWDEFEGNSSYYDENSNFYYNDEKISMQEFERLRIDIFGY